MVAEIVPGIDHAYLPLVSVLGVLITLGDYKKSGPQAVGLEQRQRIRQLRCHCVVELQRNLSICAVIEPKYLWGSKAVLGHAIWNKGYQENRSRRSDHA